MLKKCTLLLMMGMLVMFSSCKKDPVQELESRLKSMGGPSAEIGAVEYTISKIVASDHDVFYKIGERKILFSCLSTMKAGVDISKFTAENVVIDEKNNTMKVTLPKPKVIAFSMPAESIKLEWEKNTGLRQKFSEEDRLQIQKLAEEQIKGDAENLGIIKDAEDQTRLIIEGLVANFGYKKVDVVFEVPVEQPQEEVKK